MYGSDVPVQNAFRIAEKTLKKYTETTTSKKHKNSTRESECNPMPDIVDVDEMASQHHATLVQLQPSRTQYISPTTKIFSFRRHPGFFLLRDAVPTHTSERIVIDAFKKFANKPACTNFNQIYGRCLDGLWDASRAHLFLKKSMHQSKNNRTASNINSDPCEATPAPFTPALPPDHHSNQHNVEDTVWTSTETGMPASCLLCKLRWSSIGPVYDWTERVYLWDKPHLPLPHYLVELARDAAEYASLAGQLGAREHSEHHVNNNKGNFNITTTKTTTTTITTTTTNTATRCPEDQDDLSAAVHHHDFHPDAALINFYYAGDSLCGHKDDAEVDLTQPLVSVSIGIPGIFLIGGLTKDVSPTAVMLRSGDIAVLSGEARRCYHGLAKVMVEGYASSSGGKKGKHTMPHSIEKNTAHCTMHDDENGTQGKKQKRMNMETTGQGDEHDRSDIHNSTQRDMCDDDYNDDDDDDDDDCGAIVSEEYREFADHMKMCRINVSIRGTGKP